MTGMTVQVQVQAEGAELLAAAEHGDARAVERLLRAGAPLDWRDARGRTALMAATQANNVAIAQRLIQAGSDVNARDETQLSPYLCAGANGFDAILRATIEAGADLRSLNRFGASPLLPAAEKGYLRTVQMCLDAGLAVDHLNGLGWSALLEAVILGDGGRRYADVVATLVAARADIHLRDRAGRSAIWYAEAQDQPLVLRICVTGAHPSGPPPLDRVRELIRRQSYGAALDMLGEDTASECDPLDLYYYRGYLLGELGRLEDSIAQYRQALDYEPKAIEFHTYIAQCLRRLRLPDEGLREYDEAIALQPGAAFARYQKSNYLRELNRHEHARAEMDVLLAQHPRRADYWFHAANSLRSLARHKEALAAIDKALDLDAGNPLFLVHRDRSLELLRVPGRAASNAGAVANRA